MTVYNKNLASAMTDNLLKIRKKNLRNSFRDFSDVEHRMERVAELNKIIFINDSKAETANATYFALQSVKKPVVWIAGGEDSQTDYEDLLPLVRLKVEAIIMIGKDNTKLYKTFKDSISEFYQVNDLREAVWLAREISFKGTTVLFSPAAKPQGEFKNYEERGLMFKKIVRELI